MRSGARRAAVPAGASRRAPAPGVRGRAHGAGQIGLGQRQIVKAPPLGREQRVVRGVRARVQIGQLGSS